MLWLPLLAVTATTPAPAQLPDTCAGPEPVDLPCEHLAGRYEITLAPAGDSCSIKKPVSGTLVIDDDAGSSFDASSLMRAAGLRRRKDAPPELGVKIKHGVCCMDLRLYGGGRGKSFRRIIVHLARGAALVGAKADDRRGAGAECDEDLQATAVLAP